MTEPSHSPHVSFIIPVRNAAATLARCLCSISGNDYPADWIEMIVVDNGSTDGSASIAAAHGATVLQRPGLRAGGLRNAAAAIARGDILAFVDADHEIADAWVTAAVAALGRPGVGAVGAPYHSPADSTWVQRCYDVLRGHGDRPRDVEWLGSGNIAVWRDAFDSVRFDPALETCEDVDFCARLRGHGFTLIMEPRLYSTHFGDPRTLRDLFRAELWRGRDNARVTFRMPWSLRSMASLGVPVLDLTMIGASLGALLALGARAAAIVILTTAVAMVALATTRVLSRIAVTRLSAAELGRVLLVATVHDAGRALALIARTGHATRRATGAES